MKILIAVALAVLLFAVPAQAEAPLTIETAGPVYLFTGGQGGLLFTFGVPLLEQIPAVAEAKKFAQLGTVMVGTSFDNVKFYPALATSVQIGNNPALAIGGTYLVGADDRLSAFAGIDFWQYLTEDTSSALSLTCGAAPTPAVTEPGYWLSYRLEF